jgi:peptide chain release factor subunit 1
MAQIPVTTIPSADQARLRAVMRRAAAVESAKAPVLSLYLDLRPEAHGEDPARRRELVVLRDRLREIGDSYAPHTDARASLVADTDRINATLDDPSLTSVEGLAILACHGARLWEVVTADVPFQTHVSAGPTADLFQLELLDGAQSDVIALVDTNTCRLFVTRIGGLEERGGPDEPPDEHERHAQGGWSQARYQRHVDTQDRRFAREAAEASRPR